MKWHVIRVLGNVLWTTLLTLSLSREMEFNRKEKLLCGAVVMLVLMSLDIARDVADIKERRRN